MLTRNKNTNIVYSPIPTSKQSQPIKRNCNCRSSKCLKLYCECFSSGEYCTECSCQDCFNKSSHEVYRNEAIHSILERNPSAFRPKIATLQNISTTQNLGMHTRGCACKKSNCLKRYCECFQAGISCNSECKCFECKNITSRVNDILYSNSNSHSICTPEVEDPFSLVFKEESPETQDRIQKFVSSIGSIHIEKPKQDDESFLYCEEETFANTAPNSIDQSPSKQSYTYTSSYSSYEAHLLDSLINYLQLNF